MVVWNLVQVMAPPKMYADCNSPYRSKIKMFQITESVERITVGPRTLNNPSGIYVKSASQRRAGHNPNQYSYQVCDNRIL